MNARDCQSTFACRARTPCPKSVHRCQYGAQPVLRSAIERKQKQQSSNKKKNKPLSRMAGQAIKIIERFMLLLLIMYQSLCSPVAKQQEYGGTKWITKRVMKEFRRCSYLVRIRLNLFSTRSPHTHKLSSWKAIVISCAVSSVFFLHYSSLAFSKT